MTETAERSKRFRNNLRNNEHQLMLHKKSCCKAESLATGTISKSYFKKCSGFLHTCKRAYKWYILNICF